MAWRRSAAPERPYILQYCIQTTLVIAGCRLSCGQLYNRAQAALTYLALTSLGRIAPTTLGLREFSRQKNEQRLDTAFLNLRLRRQLKGVEGRDFLIVTVLVWLDLKSSPGSFLKTNPLAV